MWSHLTSAIKIYDRLTKWDHSIKPGWALLSLWKVLKISPEASKRNEVSGVHTAAPVVVRGSVCLPDSPAWLAKLASTITHITLWQISWHMLLIYAPDICWLCLWSARQTQILMPKAIPEEQNLKEEFSSLVLIFWKFHLIWFKYINGYFLWEK